MAQFSVLLSTLAPSGQGAEAGGAFVKIDGRESLLRSVELFLNRENVRQIQLVFLDDMLEEAKRKYGAHLSFSGVKVLAGGETWMEQLAAGAKSLDGDATHVVVHDAARPAVPYSDIDALLEAAEQHDAVTLTTPVRTPLAELKDGHTAVAYRPAPDFVHLLTPQVFRREVFLEMTESGHMVDPSRITLLKGSPLNVRVGGGGDATLVKMMLQLLPRPKIKAPNSPFEEAQW